MTARTTMGQQREEWRSLRTLDLSVTRPATSEAATAAESSGAEERI